MITLTGYVYHAEKAIYAFPLYSSNERDKKFSFTKPGWLPSTSQLPSSFSSTKQSSSDLAIKSSELVSKLSSFSSLAFTTSSTVSNGLEESCQYHIDHWCLQNYNLTLYQLMYVFNEVRRSKNFTRSLVKKELIPKTYRKRIIALIRNGAHLDLIVKFRVNDCDYSPIDWQGNYLILALVSIKLKIEETLSILSTLGGAYSSLGEHYKHFAIKAGETSLKQIGLACLSGDPTVIARCSIYMVYSLCQRGLHKKARRLMIKFIYPYINKMITNKTCDNILRNMYKAAKFRIEFYYKT